MAGNAWEWVEDWYGEYSLNQANTECTSLGSCRIIRGGSWNFEANVLRSALRGWLDPARTANLFGFRCALSP
jgi:formylglycine-generating enzyme required for sulfatase activity